MAAITTTSQANRLSWFATLKLSLVHVRTNGLEWMTSYTLRGGAQKLSSVLHSRPRQRERNGAPGRSSIATNDATWQKWDWQGGGEEWTESAAWRSAVIEDVLEPNIPAGGTILELGPGGGRWTSALQARAHRLILVDLSERCIELCRRRFAHADNVELYVNDGRSLPFLSDASVDSIWSFDVFVHLSPAETQYYLDEFARVLKPGGRAVIHHPTDGESNGGWRSRVTAPGFAAFALGTGGLRTVQQMQTFGPAGRFRPSVHDDTITVLEATGGTW